MAERATRVYHFLNGEGGPPSPLRGYGETAFAWLAEPKLTLRRQLA